MVAGETNKGTAVALCLYECFPSSILMLPNKFWGCGNGSERAPLGEAEWVKDCGMEAHWKGLAWEENLEKMSEKEKGTWLLTAIELSYCPNAVDFWDGLAWAFFSPLPA